MKPPLLFSSAHASLASKIGSAFAAVLLVMLLTGVIICGRLDAIRQSTASASQSHAVIAELNALIQAVTNQETGLRGYLLAGDRTFLDSYDADGTLFAETLGRLRQLLADDPAQQKRLNGLQDLAESWRHDIADAAIALMEKPDGQRDARRHETAGAGKALMDGIRSLAATMQDVELRWLAERAANHDHTLEAAEAAMVIGLLLSVVVASAVGVLLRHALAAPATAVAERMRRLANGEFDIDIADAERADELGDMARALAELRQLLVDSVSQRAYAARAHRLSEAVRAFEQSSRSAAAALEGAHSDLLAVGRSVSVTADRAGREVASLLEASLRRADRLQTTIGAVARLADIVSGIDQQIGRLPAPVAAAVEQAGRTLLALRNLAAEVSQQDTDPFDRRVGRIAERTRMLAIHARMEAVKAPDGGPGFAVVADEMSAFAADAEAASAQVGEQMAATRAAIETAVAAVQAMAAAVEEAGAFSTALTTSMASWRDETQAALDLVRGTADEDARLGKEITALTRTADDAPTVAGRMAKAISGIVQETAKLRALIERFLADAAAA